MSAPMVSVAILTFNEEVNLPECLDSVAWCDDVVVFDSHSTDRTISIAESRGARVVQRRFDNYASQRNAALNEVEYRHPWVLMVDADERVTDDLRVEIQQRISSESAETTLFRLRRKDMFLGRWLRRSSGYPTWFGRLIKVGHVSVHREINEEYHTDGRVAFLTNHLHHYPFKRGLAYWYERHNRYSSMEADTLAKEMKASVELKKLFSRDPTARRRTLKQLSYRMPGRPFLAFFYLYFIRLGFLDGFPGLYYCLLRATYELAIDLKVAEARRRERGLSA